MKFKWGETTYTAAVIFDPKEKDFGGEECIEFQIGDWACRALASLRQQDREHVKFLFSWSVAAIVLARLGPSPRPIEVSFEGAPVDEIARCAVRGSLEQFVVSRGLGAGRNFRTQEFEIDWGQPIDRGTNRKIDERTTCVVPFSGGLDSIACVRQAVEAGFDVIPVYFKYLEEDGQPAEELGDEIHAARRSIQNIQRWTVENSKSADVLSLRELSANLKSAQRVPYHTHSDPEEIDEWDYYGRDAFLASAAVLVALANGSSLISFGEAQGAIGRTVVRNEVELYDACCQSLPYHLALRMVLGGMTGISHVKAFTPFSSSYKTQIGNWLLETPSLVAESRSCIWPGQFECGHCFSCVDKQCSILSNQNENQFEFVAGGESEKVLRSGVCLGSFSSIPFLEVDREFGVWGAQLRRVADKWPNLSHYDVEGVFGANMMISVAAKMLHHANEVPPHHRLKPFLGFVAEILSRLPEEHIDAIVLNYHAQTEPELPSINTKSLLNMCEDGFLVESMRIAIDHMRS